MIDTGNSYAAMGENVEQWRRDAQVIVNRIAKLKRSVLAKMNGVKNPREVESKAVIKKKKALRKAGRELKLARDDLAAHLTEQAKRECRPLCESMTKTLPQELRDKICDEILAASTAVFYYGRNNQAMIANGTSHLEHCFDPEFTGKKTYQDLITRLTQTGSRFDFRGHHKLLEQVFDQYENNFDIDLMRKIKKVGLLVNRQHLHVRDDMLKHMEHLFRLEKGTNICFFIETGGRFQAQVARHFRQIIRILFPILERLAAAGYDVKVIVNPLYVSSQVHNSDECTFSVVLETGFRYEMTSHNATFTPEGLKARLNEFFEKYGNYWNRRS